MNLMGEPAYVGRFCGSNEYDVTPEIVAFYEDALDDRASDYAKFAPPLLHHSECYRFVGQWYLANLFGNLHARQDWELFAPIPVGSRVRSVSTIIDRYRRRGRDYVVNETDLFAADGGQLLVRGRTHQSFLPPGRRTPAEDERAPNTANPPRPPFPSPGGTELEGLHKRVDERRCWMFSGPGKNYHTDREQARNLGFPNIIVQGMMSTCFVSELMGRAFGPGWRQGGRMSIKLTQILWVDESVRVFGRVHDETPEGDRMRVHCEVWLDKDDGTRIALGTASAIRS